MGMYTEFYFRANIKDGRVADWLDRQINGEDDWFRSPYDEHEFFQSDRWSSVFIGGGAVYQESRTPIFRRKSQGGGGPYHHQLVLASSMKDYGDEQASFVEWITPHLDMYAGDFLGYSLYEDSCRDEPDGTYREHPTLYFMPKTPAKARETAGDIGMESL
jgi:hypothetical protein